MAKTGRSPRSKLRASIPDAYRARGHRVRNLWLVYSAKTDRDWLITSDRQLVHWLVFLEGNPEVLSFDLAPEPITRSDDPGRSAAVIDAIAIYRDRRVEWHDVRVEPLRDEADRSKVVAQTVAAAEIGAIYRIFSDEDLRPKARLATRWLKAVGFAAAIRGQEHGACRSALVSYLHGRGGGHVRSIISELENFDSAVVLGVLVRLSVLGAVHLDLEERSFGYATRWRSYG